MSAVYDPNPAAASQFTFCADTPAAPTGVAATLSDAPASAGDPDTLIDDATIAWTQWPGAQLLAWLDGAAQR